MATIMEVVYGLFARSDVKGATQLLRVGVSMDAPYAYAALRAEAQCCSRHDVAPAAGSTPMRHDPKPQESSRARRNQKSGAVYRYWWRGFRGRTILLEDDLRAASTFPSLASACNSSRMMKRCGAFRPRTTTPVSGRTVGSRFAAEDGHFGLGWLTSKQTWV